MNDIHPSILLVCLKTLQYHEELTEAAENGKLVYNSNKGIIPIDCLSDMNLLFNSIKDHSTVRLASISIF